MLILTIGFCTFATAFISDLEESLNQLQNEINTIENENEKFSNAFKIGLRTKLVNFIQFYAEARELSVECLTNQYFPSYFTQFIEIFFSICRFTIRFAKSIGTFLFVYLMTTFPMFGSTILQLNEVFFKSNSCIYFYFEALQGRSVALFLGRLWRLPV